MPSTFFRQGDALLCHSYIESGVCCEVKEEDWRMGELSGNSLNMHRRGGMVLSRLISAMSELSCIETRGLVESIG